MYPLDETQRSFLGTGWSFPVRFDTKMGQCALSSDEDDIRESLFILLSTRPGERLMDPTFGCDLHRIVYRQVDDSTLTLISSAISDAVLRHEPRVEVDRIDFDLNQINEGLVQVILTYTIQIINVRTNMVYPFYLIEGTNLKDPGDL